MVYVYKVVTNDGSIWTVISHQPTDRVCDWLAERIGYVPDVVMVYGVYTEDPWWVATEVRRLFTGHVDLGGVLMWKHPEMLRDKVMELVDDVIEVPEWVRC